MKASKRVPADSVRPPNPAARRPRTLRPLPVRPLPFQPGPQLNQTLADEPLRHWFDEEVEALQRLAHTQRLKGDYVAAQTLERDIRMLTSEMNAVLAASARKIG